VRNKGIDMHIFDPGSTFDMSSFDVNSNERNHGFRWLLDDDRTKEPGKTPGQAEGTEEDIEGDGSTEPSAPKRTPGQAEGTEEDVTGED
jgi:hypothetical protein